MQLLSEVIKYLCIMIVTTSCLSMERSQSNFYWGPREYKDTIIIVDTKDNDGTLLFKNYVTYDTSGLYIETRFLEYTEFKDKENRPIFEKTGKFRYLPGNIIEFTQIDKDFVMDTVLSYDKGIIHLNAERYETFKLIRRFVGDNTIPVYIYVSQINFNKKGDKVKSTECWITKQNQETTKTTGKY